MGILVEIKNKQQDGFIIYYTVWSGDNPKNPPFRVGIDTIKKYIYFYKDLDIAGTPIKIIDLSDIHSPIENFGIPPWMLGAVIRKTLKCFDENNFPESISYSA